MRREKLLSDVVRFALVVVLLGVSGGGAWAVADDAQRRDTLPAGTSVDGHDLSGMTVRQAREAIERDVAGPLLEEVTVTADDQRLGLDPNAFVRVDIDGMIERALSPDRKASLPARTWGRLTGEAPGIEVPVLSSADASAVSSWVDRLAGDLDTRAKDASLTVDGCEVVISPAKEGRQVRRAEAVKLVTEALASGSKQITVPVQRLEPKVREDSFGKTIVVSVSQRRLYLYDGDSLEKKYGVAVGTPGFPTPKGRFKIVLKRFLPTWSNPGSDWAKGMPKTIGPGPSNPLGTRALNLDAPGIRIHGTTADASIGTAASHGCMRMHRWDIEDLYPRVKVGTAVFVVP